MEGIRSNIFYVTRVKQSGGVYPARGLRSREETLLHLHPERQKRKKGVEDHGGEAERGDRLFC